MPKVTPDVAQASRLHSLGIDHPFRVLQVIEKKENKQHLGTGKLSLTDDQLERQLGIAGFTR